MTLPPFFGQVLSKDSGRFDLAGEHRGDGPQKRPIYGKETQASFGGIQGEGGGGGREGGKHTKRTRSSLQGPSDADRAVEEAALGKRAPVLRAQAPWRRG